MGVELVATLGTGLEFVDPLQIYLPKRNAKVNMANPGASFNRDYLYSPGVVFVVNQQEYDGKYILTKATHNVGSGYTCNLELRKVLEGY